MDHTLDVVSKCHQTELSFDLFQATDEEVTLVIPELDRPERMLNTWM